MADELLNPPGTEEGIPTPEGDDSALLEALGTEPGADQGQGVPPEGGEEIPLPENATPSDRQAHARMQAVLTKKTQALADQRKQLEAREAQLSGLRQLVPYLQDPRTQKFMMDTFGGGERVSEAGEDGDSELDPVVAQAVRRHTDPLASQLKNLQAQISDQHALAEFVRDHPDWEKHLDGMKAAWQRDGALGRPLRNREDAYNFAIALRVRQARERRVAAEARSRGSVAGPGAASSVPDVKTQTTYDFKQAMRAALEEQGYKPDEVLGRRDL